MTRSFKTISTLVVTAAAMVTVLAFALSHDSSPDPAPPLGIGAATMRAIIYRQYGSPDVLRLEEVEKPSPTGNELLIKVRAASLNPIDWHYMRGKPYLVRFQRGLGSPKVTRLGVDFSGTVESVGAEVGHFKVGDEIFGTADGALAEYVTSTEVGLALKPTNITFQQAASVPVAALAALQGLRDKGQLKAGQKVLINGASGGVGTFAVQIAKSMGAEVTGVCSTGNVNMVRSIGADHVIDYSKEDFTKSPGRYDLILDTVGNHALLEVKHVLTPRGTFVIIGAQSGNRWLGPLTSLIRAWFISPFVSQRFTMLMADSNKTSDLDALSKLLRASTLTPVIDRQYPLDQVPDAMRYLEAGHARGKVVVTLE